MVSALVSGSSGRGHCVVFLGKTVYSRSASIRSQPGVQMGTSELHGGIILRSISIPSRWE